MSLLSFSFCNELVVISWGLRVGDNWTRKRKLEASGSAGVRNALKLLIFHVGDAWLTLPLHKIWTSVAATLSSYLFVCLLFLFEHAINVNHVDDWFPCLHTESTDLTYRAFSVQFVKLIIAIPWFAHQTYNFTSTDRYHHTIRYLSMGQKMAQYYSYQFNRCTIQKSGCC